MPVTLADLRALTEKALIHTENPAILRLPEKERTVEGLTRAYLARWLALCGEYDLIASSSITDLDAQDSLDMTEAGTVGSVRSALAIAVGLNPGPHGVGCRWTQRDNRLRYELLDGAGEMVLFTSDTATPERKPWRRHAPTVANESDPIKALELAVRHVLDTP